MLGDLLLMILAIMYLVIFFKKNISINYVVLVQLISLSLLFLLQYEFNIGSFLSKIGLMFLLVLMVFILINYALIKRIKFAKYNIIFANYLLIFFGLILMLEVQPNLIANYNLLFGGVIFIIIFYIIKYLYHLVQLKSDRT